MIEVMMRFSALVLLLGAAPAAEQPLHVDTSGCDDLSAVPLNLNVDYDLQIKPIFEGCVDCHNSGDESGGLNLEPGVAPASLVNVASSQNGAVLRVVPGDAVRSLLFQKVNCEIQDVGFFRMPLGGSLTLSEQALIYDWIEQGACAFVDGEFICDVLFRDAFESQR